MNFQNMIDPGTASVQAAAGFGSALYLVFKRDVGWSYVVTIFFVAQVTAFYVTIPFAMWRGWSMATYSFIAFSIGALGFLIWGSAFNLLQNLHDDPRGTLTWVWRLWKGGGVADPKDGGTP